MISCLPEIQLRNYGCKDFLSAVLQPQLEGQQEIIFHWVCLCLHRVRTVPGSIDEQSVDGLDARLDRLCYKV
jgi:hypothetical protein